MPLDRFVLIVVLVIAAAAVTVWLGAMAAAALQMPLLGGAVAIPVLLVAYILWRVVADRLRNPEDERYDRIEK